MSTETAETIHVPGPQEALVLRQMTGIEQPTVNVVRHLVAHQVAPGQWALLKWSAGRNAWIRENDGQTFIRSVAVDRLAAALESGIVTNVSIVDDCLTIDGLDPLQGWGLTDLDRDLLDPERIVLCPEGAPHDFSIATWVRVDVDANGEGGWISDHTRFAGTTITAAFRTAANYAPDVDVMSYVPRMAPVLVRHDVAGRDLVPSDRWSFSGRPDLAARLIDEELVRNALEIEERDRARQMPGGVPLYLERKRIDQARGRRNA